MFKRFKKARPKPTAKPARDDVDLDLDRIPGAIELVEDFPRVNWSKVREAVKPYSDRTDLDDIWTELAAQWLGMITRHLGAPYQLYESKHLLMLSSDPSEQTNRLLRIGDDAYDRLARLLPRDSAQRSFGKHAVLLFTSADLYYAYISHFYQESDRTFATSSGIHLSRGYRHTALHARSDSVARTLVHELAHEMVSHLRLPRWLNEGLAQWAEDMVPAYRPPLIDARQARLQRRYWSWFGIQRFWDGRAFSSPSSQRVSYQLADIIFRNIATHPVHGSRLPGFLATSDRKDAGASACEQCLGCSLSALAAEFLGAGSWEPVLDPKHQADEDREASWASRELRA